MNKWTLKTQAKLKEQIRLMLPSRFSLSQEAQTVEAAEKINRHHSKNRWLVMKNRRMGPYHQCIRIEVIGLLVSEKRVNVDSLKGEEIQI